MTFIDATVFYSRVKTHLKYIYVMCFKYFSVRNCIIGILYSIIVGIIVPLVNIVFRIADEILFPNYKNIEIKQPVFIISNPRSGTTFLHRLMCLDEQKFVYFLLFHTVIPSITFFKIVGFFTSIDRKVGRPMRKFFDFVDSQMFGAWEDIHATSFNKSEEDEALHFISGISPSVGLVTPYLREFKELYIPDSLPEKELVHIRKYYKATIQKWMYAIGADKTFLCKTVMSSGRLKILREIFPDVKIIFLLRNPYEAIPSFTSMFAEPWKNLYPTVKENSEEYREWGELGISYYQYFHQEKNKFEKQNFITVPYADLIKDAKATVIHIYQSLQLKLSDDFLEKLNKETQKSRDYSSKHTYTLEQYGFDKEKIYTELSFIFDELAIEK